jgi:hypothetical protein
MCLAVTIDKIFVTTRLTCGGMRFIIQAAEDRLSFTEFEKDFGAHTASYPVGNLESFPGPEDYGA